jgi:hypothetical protein
MDEVGMEGEDADGEPAAAAVTRRSKASTFSG